MYDPVSKGDRKCDWSKLQVLLLISELRRFNFDRLYFYTPLDTGSYITAPHWKALRYGRDDSRGLSLALFSTSIRTS